MKSGIGSDFQRETSYRPGGRASSGRVWGEKPGLYKTDPGLPLISLPPPVEACGVDFLQAVRERRSTRDYGDLALSIDELATLLWLSAGLNRQEGNWHFRTAPSAGALYPIETYVIAHHVLGLPSGIYHYQVKNHQLAQLRLGDYRRETSFAALDQPMAGAAAALIVWSAVIGRSFWKYSERAFRYIYLDAGHMAGQFALGVSAMKLGACQIAAFYDTKFNELLGLDGENETVLYASTVAHPVPTDETDSGKETHVQSGS